MGLAQQKALEADYVMLTFGRKQVEFVRGEGMMLYDDEGRAYLDFLSGIGVVSLGHCHPALVRAIEDQARRLMHVSNYYYIEQRGELAQMISELIAGEGGDVYQTFFANSGAEANECAIKLARLAARKRVEAEGGDAQTAPRLIVTLEGSFHGRTLATLAATAQPAKQESFQPLPDGFASTPPNDVAALEQLFAERGGEVCAVMLEVVQGESGVHPCSEEFLVAARRLTAEVGALLICDEVQCGIYRCGAPFAFQLFGIQPDIVTMAKGIASGFPMGACAARADVAGAFAPGDHGSTFGGSCLAVAAASATLAQLAKMGAADHAARVGAYARERLAALDFTRNVRGYGLMIAFDLAEPLSLTAGDFVDAALAAGAVINATGPRTIRLLPPLVCETEHVDALIDVLAAVGAGGPEAAGLQES